MLRALKITLLTGTCLALIDDGQAFFSGTMTSAQWLSLLLSSGIIGIMALYVQGESKRQRDPLRTETFFSSVQHDRQRKQGEQEE